MKIKNNQVKHKKVRNRVKLLRYVIVAIPAMINSFFVSTMFAVNMSEAWLAANDTVVEQSSDIDSQIINLDITPSAIGTDADLLFKRPGITKQIAVVVTNHSNCEVQLNAFGMVAPTSEEEKAATDTSNYLGTQLQTYLSSIGGVEQENRTHIFLATKNAGGDLVSGDIILFSTTAGDEAIALAPEESITFTVSVEFVETNQSQNEYKHFKNSGGNCSRRFYVECEPIYK